jgi:hypothetical protein
MPGGGARPGAGRPRGRRSSKTAERLAAIEASGTTPLDYLLTVMRDAEQDKAVRLDAAKAAAPYVHPKLANIDTTLRGDASAPFVISSTDARL